LKTLGKFKLLNVFPIFVVSTFGVSDNFSSFLNAEFEANHHCAVGITGVLCMPQYLMHNVKFKKNGGNWLWFQNWVREDHSYTQVSGGIFSLSPPNAAVVMAQGRLEDSLFPDGYVSVVSSTFLYLLDHPDDACIRASDISDEIGSRYNGSKGGAILCKVPLRSLKIYTRNLLAGNSPSDLKVDAWFNSSTNSNPDATQNIRYHQSGPDNISFKQGYSIPVIPGAENKYRLSLVNDGDILKDWVIEFNDPVIGYRWDEEWITLEVKGRNCAGNGLVSSQHDRRFIWSGDEFLNDSVWDSDGNAIHGACVASGNQPDDMPSKSCTTVQFDGVEPLQCPELCVSKCNDNSFCDCGTAQCFCKPGKIYKYVAIYFQISKLMLHHPLCSKALAAMTVPSIFVPLHGAARTELALLNIWDQAHQVYCPSQVRMHAYAKMVSVEHCVIGTLARM